MEIELGEAESMGTYSNLVMITFTIGIYVDFIAVMPGSKSESGKAYDSYPDYAKRLMNALQDNVSSIAEHGLIHNKTKDLPLYRGPQAEA